MFKSTKTISVELTQPIQISSDLSAYQRLKCLIKWRGIPLGYISLPIIRGSCSTESIIQEAIASQCHKIFKELIRQGLATKSTNSWNIHSLLGKPDSADFPVFTVDILPSLSIIICPCSQGEVHLAACLNSIKLATTKPLEIVIPTSSNDSFQSIRADYPQINWLLVSSENRSVQRNLAMQAAKGEIVAFLDEDCQIEPNWVQAMSLAFANDSDVTAIIGSVMSPDLQTQMEAWCEQKYSLDHGTERLWHSLDLIKPVRWTTLATMWIASGVNMAFRRSSLKSLGGFDEALDQTSYARDGANLEIFSRVLLSGNTLLYEPSALVKYSPFANKSDFQTQVKHDIGGLYAYIAAGWQKYPNLWQQWLTLGIWKFYRSLLTLTRPDSIPRHLILGELFAIAQIWRLFFNSPQFSKQQKYVRQPDLVRRSETAQGSISNRFMAVRTIDVGQPLQPLDDIEEYGKVRVFVTLENNPIGYIDISNAYRKISIMRLQEAISSGLTNEMLTLVYGGNDESNWSSFQVDLRSYLSALQPKSEASAPLSLHVDVSVSIIITTCDRPDDLQTCLEHLLALETRRAVEIVVADNRPTSGITPKVIARFPGVKLVQEARPGAAYGRNAAIVASTGDIIVTIDDDITVPPDWLEKLIAPMARPEVMVVTGNVLPKELETPAQFLFEQLKGGLSQGYRSFEADGGWLAATQKGLPPVWDLGVSANAAFRAEIFCHPQIGLMDETLGPGTPTSGGEECYLIYRVLRANYTVVYEPSAYAWHRHRRELDALYHQVYCHMKGGMAFMLCVWLKDGDQRAFHHLFFQMPSYLTQRVIHWALRRHQAPLRFVWSEIKGYLEAFWCYRQSYLRVQQQGLSDAYISRDQRLSHSMLQEVVQDSSSISPCAATPNTLVGG